ncbi:MAG: hypothetical protein AAB383_05245 [Patescibacteria group bacterium]
MIDAEGTYRQVSWYKYDEGPKPFCAQVGDQLLRAESLDGLRGLVDGELDGARNDMHGRIVVAMDSEPCPGVNRIPRYSDVLRKYMPRDGITPERPNPKLLTKENRDRVLEITEKATEEYGKKTTAEPQEGHLVETRENIGSGRSFTMSAEIFKTPNHLLKEDVTFHIDEGTNYLGHFTLSREGELSKNIWSLFHREIYKKEYTGGSGHELGASRILTDAMYLFIQDRADRTGEEVTVLIELSQPHVAIWALKEGFQPENGEQERRWQQMQNGNDLVMKGDHVYPNTIPPGFGWDKFDYEAGFRIRFKKTFQPVVI